MEPFPAPMPGVARSGTITAAEAFDLLTMSIYALGEHAAAIADCMGPWERVEFLEAALMSRQIHDHFDRDRQPRWPKYRFDLPGVAGYITVSGEEQLLKFSWLLYRHADALFRSLQSLKHMCERLLVANAVALAEVILRRIKHPAVAECPPVNMSSIQRRAAAIYSDALAKAISLNCATVDVIESDRASGAPDILGMASAVATARRPSEQRPAGQGVAA